VQLYDVFVLKHMIEVHLLPVDYPVTPHACGPGSALLSAVNLAAQLADVTASR
jgi:hypothetical protein